jgi:hypothetical protein
MMQRPGQVAVKLPFIMRTQTLILTTLLLACSSTKPSDVWQEELDAARERWEQAGPSSYTFRYTRHCFCPQLALRVTVHHDVVTAIQDLTVDTAYVAPFVDHSIPKWFDQVQDLIDLPAHQLTATYDALTGVPLSVAADPIANAVDDEGGFTVRDFAALP